MNETIQTLLKRRSIRAHDATQIPDEDLELILQTGTMPRVEPIHNLGTFPLCKTQNS